MMNSYNKLLKVRQLMQRDVATLAADGTYDAFKDMRRLFKLKL